MKPTVKGGENMYYISGNTKTRKIKINNKILSPEHSLKVVNHSPNGFSWGYAGSGPAQLALAILLTATTEEDATRLHQTFKDDYVIKFKQDKDFSYKVPIRRWLIQHEAKYLPTEADFTPYNTTDSADDSVGRACSDQCTKAKSKECNCSCGGSLHGTENGLPTTPSTGKVFTPGTKIESVKSILVNKDTEQATEIPEESTEEAMEAPEEIVREPFVD